MSSADAEQGHWSKRCVRLGLASSTRCSSRRRCRPPATHERRLVGVGEWGPGEEVWALAMRAKHAEIGDNRTLLFRTDRRMNETRRTNEVVALQAASIDKSAQELEKLIQQQGACLVEFLTK